MKDQKKLNKTVQSLASELSGKMSKGLIRLGHLMDRFPFLNRRTLAVRSVKNLRR